MDDEYGAIAGTVLGLLGIANTPEEEEPATPPPTAARIDRPGAFAHYEDDHEGGLKGFIGELLGIY